ncbi:hypothetical protein ACFL0L_00900 [Patescibacteria group bacterium]
MPEFQRGQRVRVTGNDKSAVEVYVDCTLDVTRLHHIRAEETLWLRTEPQVVLVRPSGSTSWRVNDGLRVDGPITVSAV